MIFKFAWKNIFRNYKSNITLIILMVIGVVSLILAYGYIQNTFKGLKQSSIHNGIGHFQIMHEKEKIGDTNITLEFGIKPNEYKEIKKAINKNEYQIKAIMPRLEFSGIISKDDKSTVFLGKGIDPVHESNFSSVFLKIIKGKNLGLDFEHPNKNEVIIGRELAYILKAKVGDEITLMSTTVDGAINAIDLTLSGIFVTGVQAVDKRTIITSLEISKELLRTNKISKVVVGLYNTNISKPIFEKTKSYMKDSKFSFYFWEELSLFYKAVVSLYTSFFLFLGGLILFVVISTVFGLVNSSVISKTKEIGMLKANGFSNKEVLFLITLEILIVSFIAMFIAFTLGQASIYLINSMQITLPPPPARTQGVPLQLEFAVFESMLIALCLPVISLIASIKPSIKGARLKISQALRS
ncbi:MAG: ABC transporter permease [Arcobacter sp.]|nr:ABC transporter permease [Arcobacter sp.]